MRKIKKWICLTLLMVVTLASVAGIRSEAGHAAKYATVSPFGDIILTTYDHRKTSSVHYKTVGWTVTRCILGTKTPIDDQYFTLSFNDALEDVGDVWTTSEYMISEAQVMSRISEVDGSWLADIQGDSEQPCYLKFDAVMICIDDSKSDFSGKYSGEMLSETNQDYLSYPLADYPGVWDKFTKDDLKYNTYGWAAPASIDTHFDIYLLYNGGKPKEPVISADWYRDIYWYSPIDGKYNQDNASTIKSSLMRPKFCTWNTSDVYNLHEDIPSGEDITNYEYINNKELVQKINSKEIDLLQEKADGCIKMMFGTNSNTILSDYDNTERSMLNLFKEGTTWHDEADNDKSIDIYVADYLKALADNRYQADYQYQTDKSLIWFNNCYYVRGLVQLKVQECKDGSSLLDYYPITLQKGKTYRFIVDLGFSTSVVNETKEYTLTEINYIQAEESEEDISDSELLEVK